MHVHGDGDFDRTWFSGTVTSQLESVERVVDVFASEDETVTLSDLSARSGVAVEDLVANLPLWISRRYFSPAAKRDAQQLAGAATDPTGAASARVRLATRGVELRTRTQ